jgi:hypothetical protein
MLPRILLIILLLSFLGGGTTWAKKKKNNTTADNGPTITEVSPMSVTLAMGHDAQQTYTISMDTKITLDGAPVSADDLRAGMVAQVTLAADNQTLLTLTAKDAPRVTATPKPAHTNVWVNVH